MKQKALNRRLRSSACQAHHEFCESAWSAVRIEKAKVVFSFSGAYNNDFSFAGFWSTITIELVEHVSNYLIVDLPLPQTIALQTDVERGIEYPDLRIFVPERLGFFGNFLAIL